MLDIKISIIVPVYNVEKYINRCLDSILNQSFSEWECILIDDGSSDNSGKICDEYTKKDSRFRVIHQENSGVCVARNVGIECAKGEWLGFVDADDWISSETYKIALECAEANDAEVVQWGLVYSDGVKEWNPFVPPRGWLNPQNEIPILVFHSGYTKLLKNSFVYQYNIRFPVGISLAEDLYFSFLIYFYCKKIYGIDKTYYYYFQNPLSAMHTFSEKKVQDEHWVVSEIEKFLFENNKTEEWKAFLIAKKIQAKNNYIFKLPKPNYELWRKTFPEVTSTLICSSPFLFKMFFILVNKKLDFVANILLYLRRRIR